MRTNAFLLAACVSGWACATTPVSGLPLADADVAALANEVNGETAKRNLEGIVQFHRQRGSRGFHSAAELVAERAKAYGLSDVEILHFPADGKIFYGTQRSRMGWDADKGELTEVRDGKETLVASFAAMSVALAEDSESAEQTTDLVDVGNGDSEADYSGKNVKGKIVLVAHQPSSAQELAIGRFGAVGMVSYAPNQTTAWSGENPEQVRWGHLDSFSPHKTFAFMVSLGAGNTYKSRLAAGETIRLHASVQAGQHPGNYDIVTAVIPGADPVLRDEEIAFSCHLDHQKPGANDNASGCVTILEAGRTLQALIGSGKLAPPARTIRFIWPPEVEGTTTLLNARPEFARRIKAVIHMDMVGGGPQTQAVFHVTRGPASLPSPVQDIAWSFASWVNAQTYRYAATGKSDFPMVAASGGKEPLRAEDSPFEMGSDHEVYQDASLASRRSTSTTIRTATSTRTWIAPRTSIPPSCSASLSSAPPVDTCWPAMACRIVRRRPQHPAPPAPATVSSCFAASPSCADRCRYSATTTSTITPNRPACHAPSCSMSKVRASVAATTPTKPVTSPTAIAPPSKSQTNYPLSLGKCPWRW